MTTTTCYEVRDACGRNIGECFDRHADEAIGRAKATAKAIDGLGPLSIYRVEQRIVIETTAERCIATIDGTPKQEAGLNAVARGARSSRTLREQLAA